VLNHLEEEKDGETEDEEKEDYHKFFSEGAFSKLLF
jgi:hypothetical protein